eukprot:c21926_g2_i2 orf=477-947(-)
MKSDMAEEVSPGYRPNLQFHAGVEAYFLKVFGAEHFHSICRALTCPSRYACVRINTLQTTSQEVLTKLLDVLKDSNTSQTGLHNQGQLLPAEMLSFQNNGANKDVLCFEHPQLKDIIIVQGDGPHQIDYSGEHGLFKEVVVSRKCAEAVLRGANVC